MVEYGLLLAVVALVIVSGLVYFSAQLGASFGDAAGTVGGIQKPGAGDPVPQS